MPIRYSKEFKSEIYEDTQGNLPSGLVALSVLSFFIVCCVGIPILMNGKYTDEQVSAFVNIMTVVAHILSVVFAVWQMLLGELVTKLRNKETEVPVLAVFGVLCGIVLRICYWMFGFLMLGGLAFVVSALISGLFGLL